MAERDSYDAAVAKIVANRSPEADREAAKVANRFAARLEALAYLAGRLVEDVGRRAA